MTGLERESRYQFKVFVFNIAGRKREPASKEFNVIGSRDDDGPRPTSVPGNGCSSLSRHRCYSLEIENSRGNWSFKSSWHTGFPTPRVASALYFPLDLRVLQLFFKIAFLFFTLAAFILNARALVTGDWCLAPAQNSVVFRQWVLRGPKYQPFCLLYNLLLFCS